MDNVTLLVAAEAEDAVRELGSASLEDRASAAMRSARDHWMAPGEDAAFRGACEALARTATEDELERIKADLEGLQRAGALIGALQAGLPVDWEALAERAEEKPEHLPLGLRKLWQETAS